MSAAVPVAAALAGWLLAGLGNWLADALPRWSPPEGQPAAPLAPPRLRHWTALVVPACWRTNPRRPLLILGTVAACAAITFLAASTAALVLSWLYAAFLLTVLVIDLEQRRVLNVMVLPAAAVAVAASLLPPAPSLPMALLGGALGFGLFLLIGIVGLGALGAGDVKLMGVVGLMVGYPAILTASVLGILFGGVAALVLLISRRATRKSTFAYAPYLALGALLTLLITLGG